MIKVNKKFKKIIAILMLIITLCTCMNVEVFAKYITDMNSDATFGVISGSLNTYGHEMHYANYDGTTYMVFCTQYGKTSPNGSNYQYNNDFQVQMNNQRQEYKRIAEYIYFGYTMKYGMGLPSSTEAKKAACATQQFVWEYIRNNIDASYGTPGRDNWKNGYMSSSIYSSWLSETENYYNSYHNSNVSFNGQTDKVTIGESKTLTDSNGVLASYPSFNQNINGVIFAHNQGSNDIVVTADANCNVTSTNFATNQHGIYRLMPNGATYNQNQMSSYIYFHFTSGKVQDLLFSNYTDPSFFNFNIEVESGKISLKKVNNMGNAISGCKFELYTDVNCTNKIGNATTNGNGTILFEKLRPGTYYIKEVEVAPGYLIDNTIKTVNVVAGQTSSVEFKNNEPTGKILIHKINDNGDSIGNAEFTVKAAETIKNKAGTKTHFNKGDLVATIKSDVTTGIATIDGLPLGKYEVQESKAPVGYLLNTTKYEAVLTYKDSITPVVELQIKGVVNEEPTGSLVILKKDKETGSIAQGDAMLKDAVYKVYAKEDIYNVAKTKKFYSKGDLVATRTTNDKGETEDVTGLPLGKYMIKEEKAPIGYLLDKTEYEINLTYKDQYTKIITGKTTSTDQVKKMQIHIYKSGIKENSGLTPGIQGAEFTIKLYSDVEKAMDAGFTYAEIWGGLDEEGKTVKVDSKRVASAQVIAPSYDRVVTNENGDAYSNNKLPFGKYWAKETITPKDFHTATDFSFSIDKDESEVQEVAQKVKHFYVNDEQMEAYIKLVKKDADSEKIVTLNSATFQIKAKADIFDRGTGKIIYKKGEVITQKIGSTVYNSFTTNSDNLIVPDGSYSNNKEDNGTVITPLKLGVGKYEIAEIKIPDGFLEIENPIEFEIKNVKDYDQDNGGDYIKEVVIKNAKPTGTIIIDKSVALKDNVDTSIVDISDLSKIKFRIKAKYEVKDMADGSIIYKEGQEINTYNLDKEGNLSIADLPMGSYILEEIETLDGLVLSDEKIEVTFTQKDTTTKVYTETREVKNDTTITEISKKLVTGEDELEGAKLSILNGEKVIDTWTSTNKAHIIEGLVVGKEYTLREDLAPLGVVKSSDVKFKIENTEDIQKATMVDKILEISKTDLTNGEELEGANLKVIDEEGNIIEEWISEKTPHKVSGLEEGKKYTLVETIAPYGYEITESITFEVTKDKETQLIEMKDMPILKNIKVVKLDSDTNEVIKAHFRFGIYEDQECTKLIKEVDSNIKEGIAEFKDLRYGTYYIKETVAPSNYQLSEKIVKIEINEDGVFADSKELEEKDEVYSFEFYDTLIPAIQTGTEINNILLISLIAISLIGIITGIIFLKRKSN